MAISIIQKVTQTISNVLVPTTVSLSSVQPGNTLLVLGAISGSFGFTITDTLGDLFSGFEAGRGSWSILSNVPSGVDSVIFSAFPDGGPYSVIVFEIAGLGPLPHVQIWI